MKKIYLWSLFLALSVWCDGIVLPNIRGVAGDNECKVHHEKLKRGKVPIHYGLPVFDPFHEKARAARFPHANSSVLGGCIVSEDSPKEQDVSYCEGCRVAEKKWSEKRRKSSTR